MMPTGLAIEGSGGGRGRWEEVEVGEVGVGECQSYHVFEPDTLGSKPRLVRNRCECTKSW